jgi:hypothetical protein
MYPYVAMVKPVCNLNIITWSRLFIFFESLFYSLSYVSCCFRYFAILFLLFSCLLFWSSQSDLVVSIFLWIIGRLSGQLLLFRMQFFFHWYSYMTWHPEKSEFLSFFVQKFTDRQCFWISWVNVVFYYPWSLLREFVIITYHSPVRWVTYSALMIAFCSALFV